MLSLIRPFYVTYGGPLAMLVLLHAVGTMGYRLIGGMQYSLLDCFYMSFITIATIGYAEVVDVSGSVAGRLFTVFLGSAGIGTVYYILAKMTMSLVAGELNVILRRGKMLKRMSDMQGHYIVCGIGRVGGNVAHELMLTGRPYVVIDISRVHIDAHLERSPGTPWLHGDASQDELLREAGIERAAGVFAVTGDDSRNLVITLSARQLNPALRIVARCHEVTFIDKIRKVGADAIVSPDFTGGMRIASAMIRPQVVNFLDEMRRTEDGLRVEEVTVPAGFAGGRVSELLPRSRDYMLVAVRAKESWQFNPPDEFAVAAGNVLVLMTNAAGLRDVATRVAAN